MSKRGRASQSGGGAQPPKGQSSITSFFASAAKPPSKPPAASPHQQPAKKQRAADGSDAARTAQAAVVDEDVVLIDVDEGKQQQQQPAAPAGAADEHQQPAAAAAAAAPPRTSVVPEVRDPAAFAAAQAKLVASLRGSSSVEDQDPAAAAAAAGPSSSSGRRPAAPKYTPLEQQVVNLKAAHPGVLLIVEVGYKFKFFGEDAEAAARELGIVAWQDHNFKTASIPVQRLPIHLRRLVAAGHKVGVVRQTESAALKAAGDNKSGPFTRSVTGLYTAGTLDAAEKADKLGEAGAMEDAAGLETLLGGSSGAPAANHILVLAEQHPAAGDVAGVLGVVAIDAGSGDVVFSLCSASASSSSSGAASTNGGGLMPLEAVLLSVCPADLVVCEPVSAVTDRLLSHFLAGSSRRCRLERLQPEQWRQQQQQAGRSSSRGAATSAAAAAPAAGSYLDAGVLSKLTAFFASGPSSSAAAAGGGAGSSAAAAASDASDDSRVRFVLSLPHPVLAALAGALAYLLPFGLAGVLKCTSAYRALRVGGTLALDAAVLTQLEVLQSGGAEGRPQLRGSLLHVLDRCSTPAGGRMLRRWLAAPLADRNAILDRQQAVQVLLDSSQGGSGSAGDGQQQQQATHSGAPVLQQLPRWLASSRQDLERALSRVAAGTAAPAEAVGLWSTLAQFPAAVSLPLVQTQQQPDGQAAAAGEEVDLAALSASVPSRLLVALLATVSSAGVAGAARDVLASLNVQAAAANDFLQLYKDERRFADVAACHARVAAAERHLQDLLPQLASAARVGRLSYVTIQNQGSYLVELPAARADVPPGWDRVCATQKVCRYHPAEVKAGMAALARAQEQLQAACAAAWSQLLQAFSAAHHAAFREAVAAVAQLDALQGLSVVAAQQGYCRPQFLGGDEPQQLTITEGKHPMLDLALDGGAVPNSLALHSDGVRAAIITGPNMGGKSVLMRQAAVTVLMAQIGAWVPAASCVLSVFDGVFVRSGASDSLLLGRSTFAEELGEASHILAHATSRSLVIIDELGRGTATFDGVSIATATLDHLVRHTRCLTVFVSHFPEVAALANHSSSGSSGSSPAGVASDPGRETDATFHHAAAWHMAFVREDAAPDAADAEAAAVPVISFLYKLAPGAADSSFGLNVAKMAGLPASVVSRAALIAAQLKRRLGHAGVAGSSGEQEQQEQDAPTGEPAGEAAPVWALCCSIREALLAGGGASGEAGDSAALHALQQAAAALLAAP